MPETSRNSALTSRSPKGFADDASAAGALAPKAPGPSLSAEDERLIESFRTRLVQRVPEVRRDSHVTLTPVQWAQLMRLISDGPQLAPEVVTAKEVAQLCRVSVRTVHQWSQSGRLTPIVFADRCVRFRLSDVRRHIEESAAMVEGVPR
jgi:hypothetical protein